MGHVGPFLVECIGIYEVLHQYILVWIYKKLTGYSTSTILCHNRVRLTSTIQVHIAFYFYWINAWNIIYPHNAPQSHPQITEKLCVSNYVSTILVCVVSNNAHVVLGPLWSGCLKWFLTSGGCTSPVVFHNTKKTLYEILSRL